MKKIILLLTILVQVFLLPAQEFYPLVATENEDHLYYAEVFRRNQILSLNRKAAKIFNLYTDTIFEHQTLVHDLEGVDHCFSQLNLYNNRLETIEAHKFHSTADSIIIYQNMTIDDVKKEVYLWGSLFTPTAKTKQLLVLDFDLKEKQKVIFNDSIDFKFINAGVNNHFIINNFNNLVAQTKNGVVELDMEGNVINNAADYYNFNFHQNHQNRYIAPTNSGYYISDATFQNIEIKTTRTLFDLGATFLTYKYKFNQNKTFFLFQTLTGLDKSCSRTIGGSNDVILKFNTQTYEYYPFYIDSISECTKKRPGNFSIDFYNEDYVYIANKFSDCGFINLDVVDSTNVCNIEFINIKCIDREGQLRWSKDLGGDAAYYPLGVLALPDSCSIVLVKRNQREINTAFESDIYYTKLDKHGNIVKPLPVSVNEPILMANTIRLFPNPAQNYLKIQHANNQNIQLKLYNLYGQLIFSKNVNPKSPINIQHLPSGAYAYMAQTVKGETLKCGKLLKW